MRINILFILPSLRRGGAETQLITLANALCSSKFHIHVACFDNGTHQLDRLSPSIHFHHFPRAKKFDTRAIHYLSKIIMEENIDFIHCTLQIALFYGWAARVMSKRKPKLLVTVHTTVNFNFRAELFDWLFYQWIMRRCDAIVFVCKEQKSYWERKWNFIKRKGTIIYNGIDLEHFKRNLLLDESKYFRTTHGIASDSKIIAHIAGFRAEKGHATLVRGFTQVAIKSPDAILVFAGDGALRPEIEFLCQQMKLSHQVRFIGNVSDVRPLLANAYISIIASTSETFSIAMLESMAMDVPLVAINIGGTKEAVIHGETGWLVAPDDTNILAQTICEALTDTDSHTRFSESCREKVLRHFTVQKMAAGYAELFLNAPALAASAPHSANVPK